MSYGTPVSQTENSTYRAIITKSSESISHFVEFKLAPMTHNFTEPQADAFFQGLMDAINGLPDYEVSSGQKDWIVTQEITVTP